MDNKEILDENAQSVEENILDAARKVFARSGYEGARMQEIADEAGVNKALLHYYFRSKDNLFDAIFSDAFKSFWPNLAPILLDEKSSMKDIIWHAVNGYMDILTKLPYLPVLIVGELNRSPENIEKLFNLAGIQHEFIVEVIKKSIVKGEMYPTNPQDLILNVLGMIISPFLTRPLLNRLFSSAEVSFEQFLNERRESLFQFICRAVLVNPEL